MLINAAGKFMRCLESFLNAFKTLFISIYRISIAGFLIPQYFTFVLTCFNFMSLKSFRLNYDCTVVEFIREGVTKLFHKVEKTVQWICSRICHKNNSAHAYMFVSPYLAKRPNFLPIFCQIFLKFPYF